jgi:predicted HTH transcriptional regulator
VIRENPLITQREIAARLGISERTAFRATSGLRKKGIIYREGARKFGAWIIIFE